MRSRDILITLAGALAACGSPRTEGEEPGSAPARSAAAAGTPFVVLDTTVTDGFEASGIAEPVQRAVLATKLMTRVTAVLVHEGEQVRAGQILARLDARELDAKQERLAAGLAGAEASWRDAEAHARRMRALYADSAAPRAQLDQAEAALGRAEAGVRDARAAGVELEAMGDYAIVRAPFAGMVTRRSVDPGALAAPGQPLLIVEDASELRISVTASPDAAREVRRGTSLQGTVAGRGTTARVEGVVPAEGGHLATINAIVANPGLELVSGSAATLLLPGASRVGRVVPTAAIVREGDLTGIRLRRSGVWELRWVRLGAERAGQVEVLSGVATGDTVLVPEGSR